MIDRSRNSYKKSFQIMNMLELKGMGTEEIKKVQAQLQYTIENSVLEHSDQLLLYKTIVRLPRLIAANALAELHMSEHSANFTQEHKDNLLSDYAKSKLHAFSRDITQFDNELKNGIKNLYKYLAGHIVEIFLSSFPMIDVNKAYNIIDIIINSIAECAKTNNQNEIIVKISQLAIRQLTVFKQRYHKICFEYYDISNVNKLPLVLLHNDLNSFIQGFIPVQCKTILASYHDKAATIISAVVMSYKKDPDQSSLTEQLKSQAIEHYKNAISLSSKYYPVINTLYCAEINLHTVDIDMREIQEQIKTIVTEIKNDAGGINIKNTYESLYFSVEKYLLVASRKQLGVLLDKGQYDGDVSLTDNLLNLVRGITKQLQQLEMDKITRQCNEIVKITNFNIHHCQVMEQLFNESDLKLCLPDVFQKLMTETMYQKLLIFQDMYKVSHDQINNIIPVSMERYLEQYEFAVNYLVEHDVRYKVTEDILLDRFIIYMINNCTKHGNYNQAAFYLNKKNALFAASEVLLKNNEIVAVEAKAAIKDENEEKIEEKFQEEVEIIKEIEIKDEIRDSVKEEIEENVEINIEEQVQDVINEETLKIVPEKNEVSPQMVLIEEHEKPQSSLININMLNEERPCPEKPKFFQLEKKLQTDDILLNGAGTPISYKALNTLNELDLKIRATGSNLVINKSFAARFGIYCFNENKEIAKLFPVNDINVYIRCDNEVREEVINIIKEYSFKKCWTENGDSNNAISNSSELFPKKVNQYAKYLKNIKGTCVEITLMSDCRHQMQQEFLTLKMGNIEFVHFDDENSYKEAILSDRIIIQAGAHLFELFTPKQYKEEYINACKMQEFGILLPSTHFNNYCYGIYHYASKLYACGNQHVLKNCVTPGSALNVTSYSKLFMPLQDFFLGHMHSDSPLCYLELNEFIKRKINPETQHLAVLVISAFYCALICYQERDSGRSTPHDVKFNMASICANNFIDAYCLDNGNKQSQFNTNQLKQISNALTLQIWNETTQPVYYQNKTTVNQTYGEPQRRQNHEPTQKPDRRLNQKSNNNPNQHSNNNSNQKSNTNSNNNSNNYSTLELKYHSHHKQNTKPNHTQNHQTNQQPIQSMNEQKDSRGNSMNSRW